MHVSYHHQCCAQFRAGVDFTAMACSAELRRDSNIPHSHIRDNTTRLPVLAQQTPRSSATSPRGSQRLVVPATFRRTLFYVLHGLSRPYIRATQKLLIDRCVWHGIRQQVGSWTRSCKSSKEAKIQRHIRAPMQTFNVPHQRFDHINIDIVGPLPLSGLHPPTHNIWSVY